MLDVQSLRNDIDAVARRLADRGVPLDTQRFQVLESERKTLQTRTQELQARRNQASKQIGQAKQKGEDASALMAEVAAMADELKRNETRLDALQAELTDFLLGVPNVPHESVPRGRSADDNVEVATEDAQEMVHRLALEEGLLVGTSSGANVFAALRLAQSLPDGSVIVTILCDGGERYLD